MSGSRFTFLVIMLLVTWQALAQPAGPDTLWTRMAPYFPQTYYRPDILTLPDQTIVVGGGLVVGLFQRDYFIARYDTLGNLLGYHTYDFREEDESSALCRTAAGNIALAGWNEYGSHPHDQHLLQLAPDGELLDAWTWSGPVNYQIYAVTANWEGGFLLGGSRYFGLAGGGGWYLRNTNAAGDTLWTLDLPGQWGGFPEAVLTLARTADSAYVAGGYHVLPEGGPGVPALLKLSRDGDVLFLRRYEWPDMVNLWIEAVGALTDGYVWSSSAWQYEQPSPFMIRVVRTDLAGDTVWTYQQSVTPEYANYFSVDMVTTPDGGTAVAAVFAAWDASSGVVLLRLSAAGALLWSRHWRLIEDEYLSWLKLDRDERGRYAISTVTDHEQLVLLCTEPEPPVATAPRPAPLPQTIVLDEPYPNPFNSTTTLRFALPVPSDVRLTLFDVTGRVVMERNLGRLAAGEHGERIEAEEMASGIYFVRLQAGDVGMVRKVALVR